MWGHAQAPAQSAPRQQQQQQQQPQPFVHLPDGLHRALQPHLVPHPSQQQRSPTPERAGSQQPAQVSPLVNLPIYWSAWSYRLLNWCLGLDLVTARSYSLCNLPIAAFTWRFVLLSGCNHPSCVSCLSVHLARRHTICSTISSNRIRRPWPKACGRQLIASRMARPLPSPRLPKHCQSPFNMWASRDGNIDHAAHEVVG